jgi:hypothetical protein
VDAGVARPLIEGLSTETIVTDPSGARLFDLQPMSFHDALTLAVADELSRKPVQARTGPRRAGSTMSATRR